MAKAPAKKAPAKKKAAAKAKPKPDALAAKAKEILELAEKHGVEHNYLFVTTFRRYQVQLSMLGTYEELMAVSDPTVEKEYVKGSPNMYANPIFAEYNKTADAANRTVSTLMNIITKLRGDDEEESDPLLDFILTGR